MPAAPGIKAAAIPRPIPCFRLLTASAPLLNHAAHAHEEMTGIILISAVFREGMCSHGFPAPVAMTGIFFAAVTETASSANGLMSNTLTPNGLSVIFLLFFRTQLNTTEIHDGNHTGSSGIGYRRDPNSI